MTIDSLQIKTPDFLRRKIELSRKIPKNIPPRGLDNPMFSEAKGKWNGILIVDADERFPTNSA